MPKAIATIVPAIIAGMKSPFVISVTPEATRTTPRAPRRKVFGALKASLPRPGRRGSSRPGCRGEPEVNVAGDPVAMPPPTGDGGVEDVEADDALRRQPEDGDQDDGDQGSGAA